MAVLCFSLPDDDGLLPLRMCALACYTAVTCSCDRGKEAADESQNSPVGELPVQELRVRWALQKDHKDDNMPTTQVFVGGPSQ